MPVLYRSELGTLLQRSQGPALSLYFPTHHTGDTRQDPIRLKNLLREAEAKLVATGMRAPEARQMLEPAEKLVVDALFWQYQSDSLAIFAAPGEFRRYRLPFTYQELVMVGERYHVKPVLSLFTGEGLFYALALSQNHVRFLQCTRSSFCLAMPEGIPKSMAETLRYDVSEKQEQFRKLGGGTMSQGVPTMSFGFGTSEVDEKQNILRYFHQIDHALHSVLKEEKAPLVVVGVDYLHPIYRQANTYGNLLEQGVTGNPDEWSNKDIQQKAYPVVEPYFQQDRKAAANRFGIAERRNLTMSNVEQVVLAAYDGRVDTLFIATGAQQWGTINLSERKVTTFDSVRPGAEDLLNRAAVYALASRGVVYTVPQEEVPNQVKMAAILRY